MNREQIIQIAQGLGMDYVSASDLERFASAIRSATKDEDAKICDVYEQRFKEEASKNDGRQSDMAFGRISASSELAEFIRASK